MRVALAAEMRRHGDPILFMKNRVEVPGYVCLAVGTVFTAIWIVVHFKKRKIRMQEMEAVRSIPLVLWSFVDRSGQEKILFAL